MTANVRTVTVDEAAEIVEAGTHTVFDVNSPQRYEQGHLPGAINIAKDDVAAALPADKSAPVLFYCGSITCQAAPSSAAFAAAQGHTDVSVLSAGISGWEEAGRPTETV
ncbi:MAG: rhodanese-like domain-containing protein [Microbacterium sp.]